MRFQVKEHSVPSISTSEQGEDERGDVPVTSAGFLILDKSVNVAEEDVVTFVIRCQLLRK